MEVDHIFIFSDSLGSEADGLVDLGLTEGSSRVHPGQGTTNRKFYFKNFFLEILWVSDEEEIINERTRPIGLWERANHQANKYARFGLCLKGPAENKLFSGSHAYRPVYLPDGYAIDVLPNHEFPSLPWTFKLPAFPKKTTPKEPTAHLLGIKNLTSVAFGIQKEDLRSPFISYFKEWAHVTFFESSEPQLRITFDGAVSNQEIAIPELQLVIRH